MLGMQLLMIGDVVSLVMVCAGLLVLLVVVMVLCRY